MIISISGTSGSGKSTVAKLLAAKLKFSHYSMGDLQREYAKDKGISIVELGAIEKDDDRIDKEIDEIQMQLGRDEDNFVIDSWLGAHFIPHAFKVFIDVDINVRAKRICQKRVSEEYKDIKHAKIAIQKKESDNKERWLAYYSFDYSDPKNYDMIIDSDDLKPKEIVDRIIKEFKKYKK